MDFGGVYMNTSKHSSDLDIASLHKALHDLQSYVHLILRIIGGLAGFTSDHLSSELINELSKISHDSTVQVIFPYKSSSVRTMTSVPQSYYMNSKDSDYSSCFNMGVKDSTWSGIHYSTFFSNLAKSLPASSATDSRESHQLGLNQVVRPNPRKAPLSVFATYNPSLKQDKLKESSKTKLHKQYVEINQPNNIKAHQSDLMYGNNHDKLKISSEKEIDYKPLKSKIVSFAESKESTQARDSSNTADEREMDVLPEECSRRLDLKSVGVQNQGYCIPSHTTSVEVGQFVQRNCLAERGKKRLSKESKSLTFSEGSLNVSCAQILPEECKAGIAQPVFFNENIDIKADKEHKKSSNINKLLKTDVINEQNPTHKTQLKLVERNYKISPLTVSPKKTFISPQEKVSFNGTESSKISLVDVKLLQENFSNAEPDKTPSNLIGNEINQEDCMTYSKKTLNCGQDLCIIPLQNNNDQPLASLNQKDITGIGRTISTHVEMGEFNDVHDSTALLHTSPEYLADLENVGKEYSLTKIKMEKPKALVTKIEINQIKEDDSGEPLVSMAVSANNSPKFPIVHVEPSNIEINKVPSSTTMIGSSMTSSIEKTNGGKDTITTTEVETCGGNNENDPAAFINTALKFLSCRSDCNDLSSAQSVTEFSNPSVSNKIISPKIEEICNGKPKVKISSISDHNLTCKIDRRTGVANLSARGILSKLPKVINSLNTKKNLTTKKDREPPWKFDRASSNPYVGHEDLEGKCIKYYSAVDANLEKTLRARPALPLKLPDMPDLVDNSDNLRVQNSPSKVNEDCSDFNVKFLMKDATPILKESPKSPRYYFQSASKELSPAYNSDDEISDNDLEIIEDETPNKVTSEKLSEAVTEFEDTSDTNELSDDDSEGKLVIDIPDPELVPKPSYDSVSSKVGFNHPKKNWRIKMLQDNNQVDSHRNVNIDAIRLLKTPNLNIGQDLLQLSRDSLSNLSADSNVNQMHGKSEHETSPLRISKSGEKIDEVRFSPGIQTGSTLLSASDQDSFKNLSSDVSTSDKNTDATELFHNNLKHLPIEIQHGLRKRNKILMKYLSTVCPNSQLQGKHSTDLFYRPKDPDLGLSVVDKSFVSRIFDNSGRVIDEETENGMLGFKIKDEEAMDFSGSYDEARKNKIMDGAYNPELDLKLKLAEDRTIDSDNSFLSYILRGYNTSAEEGSSQGSYSPRKINESCFFPLGDIGRNSLLKSTGEIDNEREYTPKEKRRKTNADRNFDTDHRKRREKNNEASKRHRESKKKLQKEAFDNITKLEEINLRLRQKAEKLDSAVKQVLKVITTLSTNS